MKILTTLGQFFLTIQFVLMFTLMLTINQIANRELRINIFEFLIYFNAQCIEFQFVSNKLLLHSGDMSLKVLFIMISCNLSGNRVFLIRDGLILFTSTLIVC